MITVSLGLEKVVSLELATYLHVLGPQRWRRRQPWRQRHRVPELARVKEVPYARKDLTSLAWTAASAVSRRSQYVTKTLARMPALSHAARIGYQRQVTVQRSRAQRRTGSILKSQMAARLPSGAISDCGMLAKEDDNGERNGCGNSYVFSGPFHGSAIQFLANGIGIVGIALQDCTL
ncbi:hypothetical protein K488DRAFT_70032 [Vararia minispora EC-137]|uniref:Uncharacterized protein n=1 Tax=Vararia minispora EC-137 TaxID=1314806 RepID=A0ACB8QNQ1_9AGAM|nr:hypothetical protein K488DRAFT_70032 [Vararia minispora EC-137]